jgi:hypothetical protein
MIIYFAGNLTCQRERKLLLKSASRLFSFHYHAPSIEGCDGIDGNFSKPFAYRLKLRKRFLGNSKEGE